MTSAPSAAGFVRVDGLCKVFGDPAERALELLRSGLEPATIFEQTQMTIAVRDASFEVQRGQIFVVMGLSGSGKSTLLRMLNRLIEPSVGRVFVDSQDVTRLDRQELVDLRRQKTAMVFQSFALLPHLNVLDNVAFGLEVCGVSRPERRELAHAALQRVGLQGQARHLPRELSGGMKQRVGLARALCVEPELLLMDEAFSALDPLIRSRMQEQLLELQAERPRTIVFISHDIDEAMRIGDRIAIMRAGRIVQIGTPTQLVQDPADDFVRSFFAAGQSSSGRRSPAEA